MYYLLTQDEDAVELVELDKLEDVKMKLIACHDHGVNVLAVIKGHRMHVAKREAIAFDLSLPVIEPPASPPAPAQPQ